MLTHDVSVPRGTTTVSAGTCAAPTPQAVNGGVPLAPCHRCRRNVVTASAPVDGAATATQWDVQFENTSGSHETVSTWVLCTNGTSVA